MAEKSPRSNQTKTVGKSIKEKRAAKRASSDSSHTPIVPPHKPTH